MKLYYMYDDKFVDMKDMFLHSMKDQFELIDIKIDSPKFSKIWRPKFEFDTPNNRKIGGGLDIWKLRVSNIINIIRSLQPNESFIFSDIDIVFYKQCIPTINDLIKNKDILFLRELYDGIHELQGGNINFGFNIIKSNKKTERFFVDVLDIVATTSVWEQKIINKLLYNKNNYDLNWDLLPPTFLSTSVGHNNISKDTLLYHANCAVTKSDKFKLINLANEIALQTCA